MDCILAVLSSTLLFLAAFTLNFTAIILNFKRLITNDNAKIEPLKNGNRRVSVSVGICK